MALIKNIDTNFGVTANYTNIQTVQTYFKDGALDVTLLIYLDEAARKAGKQPIAACPPIRFTLEQLGTSEPTRAAVYKAIKTLPDWSDAKDG